MTIRVAAVLAALAITACSGCQTDNSSPTANTAEGRYLRPGRNSEWLLPVAKVNAIAAGMTGEEVRNLLGTPNATEPFTTPSGNGQVWVYSLAVETLVHQISTGVREIPSWDPIANIPTVTREPIMANRRVKRTTTLELLMIDDRLVERRPGRYADVNID